MLEYCVVFTSLIQPMKKSRILQKKIARRKLEVPMPVAQCLAKLDARSTGRPVAQLKNTRQNTLASWKPMNLRESARKDLFIKIMKIISLEKGKNSLSHYNLVHNLIPMPQGTKNTRCESCSG